MEAKWLQKILFLLNTKYNYGYYPELTLHGLGSCSTLFEFKIRSEPIFSQYQVLHTFLEVFMKTLKMRKRPKKHWMAPSECVTSMRRLAFASRKKYLDGFELALKDVTW